MREGRCVAVDWLDDGPVELVAGHDGPRLAEHRVGRGDRLAVAQGQPPRHLGPCVEHTAHGVAVQFAGEVEQAGTLRADRRAPVSEFGDVGTQRGVVRQRLGVHLGESPADDQPAGAVGQRLVVQRVERDHLRSGGTEEFGGLGVGEGERRAAGDGDDRPLRRGRCELGVGIPGGRREWAGGAGEGAHRVDVDRRRNQRTEPVHGRRRLGRPFGDRDQAEVAGRRGHRLVAPEHTEHANAEVVERGPQDLLVAGGPDPVEHHPADPDPAVVRREPGDHRGDRAALRGGVHDQDDRGVEQPSHVRGRAVRRGAAAVVHPHHALDHGDVGTAGAMEEERRDQVLAAQHGVEVAARAAGGEGVVAGVDVVGADLVRRDGEASSTQRRHQPGGDRGLAVAGRRCGDHDPRDAYHSIPR